MCEGFHGHNSLIFTEYDLCPCLVLPNGVKAALAQMMDVSLLKNPVFMMIGISNLFGMAGLYVPFVYLVDAAKLDVSFSVPYKNLYIYCYVLLGNWQ